MTTRLGRKVYEQSNADLLGVSGYNSNTSQLQIFLTQAATGPALPAHHSLRAALSQAGDETEASTRA